MSEYLLTDEFIEEKYNCTKTRNSSHYALVKSIAQTQLDMATPEIEKAERDRIRCSFLKYMTEASETKDARRKEFNQAIFDPTGYAVFSGTDLDMVMAKLDKALGGEKG